MSASTSIQKSIIRTGLRNADIDEFLAGELDRAGYTKVEISKTTLGLRLVVHAARPGMVIGRRGQSIRDLTMLLEQKFGLENPQISVATVEFPDLEPKVVAGQIVSALERGIHFRRAAYWALQRVTSAGALGVEISINGKLSTERGRSEKFRQGYLPKSGEPVLKQVKTAVAWVKLKQGLLGVQVKILPPTAHFPDKPTIKDEAAKVAEPAQATQAESEPTEAGEEEVAIHAESQPEQVQPQQVEGGAVLEEEKPAEPSETVEVTVDDNNTKA